MEIVENHYNKDEYIETVSVQQRHSLLEYLWSSVIQHLRIDFIDSKPYKQYINYTLTIWKKKLLF